ncbi:MAG: Ig-like domain-containing protein, partial [Cellulophaga sp.]
SSMNQNGDDAIELFEGNDVIETYGDVNVDGTGESWEYAGSWAYKLNGNFVAGGVDCAAGSTSTQTSSCAYPSCN